MNGIRKKAAAADAARFTTRSTEPDSSFLPTELVLVRIIRCPHDSRSGQTKASEKQPYGSPNPVALAAERADKRARSTYSQTAPWRNQQGYRAHSISSSLKPISPIASRAFRCVLNTLK